MKIRIITAVIALLLFFPIVIFGNWLFYTLMYIIATVGLFELAKMRLTRNYPVPFSIAVLLTWCYLFPEKEEEFAQLFFMTKLEVTLLAMLLLLSYTVLAKNKFTFEDAGFLMLSGIYLGLGFHFLIMARIADLHFVFYGILVIIATDIGAYFVGRSIGKKKLWPIISPNKTVEGAIGGILSACVVAVAYQLVFSFHSSLLIVVLVTVLASAAGQVGDLVESAFKRYYKVKDSGKILPGHGGVLDRFDSWLFVFPLLFIIHFIS